MCEGRSTSVRRFPDGECRDPAGSAFLVAVGTCVEDAYLVSDLRRQHSSASTCSAES